MVVIGFFQQLFLQLPVIFNFVITPIGELNSALDIPGIGQLTIIGMFSVGIGITMLTFLVIHAIRLFVGG